MAAEYIGSAQDVSLNSPVIMDASIPCRKGYIYHEDGTGIFILRGITEQCFAAYQVTVNGNIAIPEGGTAGPIALAITVNGEPRISSRGIFTPSAAQAFGNITCTAVIRVPKGCCFSVAVESVPAAADPAATPAPVISVADINMTVSRIA